jgi:hypothetical protein
MLDERHNSSTPTVMRHFIFFIALAAVSAATISGAASAQTRIDIPVLELPYNTQHGIRAPGMQQSLAITTDFYEYTHAALARISSRHKVLTNVGITLFDYFTIAVPFADAWLHEEWHRAIIGNRGIDSKDEVWNLKNIFAEAISVTHISDEDLIRLKRQNPVDFVRAKAAGLEAENELITNLESKAFFNRTKAFHAGLYWLVALNDQLYVGAVTGRADSAEIDSLTDDANMKEKRIAERDLSGHDFTAWVYHLFRPDEPLEARGVHPSGVGVNRYIKVSDLTPDEKRYLKRAGKLMWLNFVDPNFLGEEISFNNGRGHANIWLRYMLTSFGDVAQAHVVYEQGNTRLHVTGMRYANYEKSFPGLQAEALEMPLRVGSASFAISPRASAWMQPQNQTFKTKESAFGGMLGARFETRGKTRLQLYIDAELKSAGWIAGRPSLESGGTFRTGMTYALGKTR